MKVKDLVEKLLTQDQEAKVYIEHEVHGLFEITVVTTEDWYNDPIDGVRIG